VLSAEGDQEGCQTDSIDSIDSKQQAPMPGWPLSCMALAELGAHNVGTSAYISH
jgi:hypothetical protein